MRRPDRRVGRGSRRSSAEKTPLCTGRETIAFEATGDGVHTLTLDSPAAQTAPVAVTLFLDEPEVVAGGEFVEVTYFINGSRSSELVVEAAYRRGVARVWVRRQGAGIVASSALCRRRCPAERKLRKTIDTRRLGEGRHQYAVEAVGSDGRRSDIETWEIYVDRTPPRPPKNFRVVNYAPVTRNAGVFWDEGVDPGGPLASGAGGHHFRLRREGGSWSPWRYTDVPYLFVKGVVVGSVLDLRVRQHHGATSTSRIAEARVRVTGSEPPPEPE